MIDRSHIGRELAPSVLDVEKGRLRFFAQAIGETDPVYTDETAARAAGYPALPAPPTFLFAAELDSRTVVSMLDVLGVDPRAQSCTASRRSPTSRPCAPATG